jgi:uncharacterized phage protein gp47/JayE
MAIATKNFATLVSDWAAAAQAACATLLDFSIGSILLSVAEAQAGVSLWLQAVALQVLTRTRLSTSQATDVDTFVADFGLTRMGATASQGVVTFSRFTPTNAAFIPVGVLLQTSDGSQQFTVYADGTNGAFNFTLNSYRIAPGVASLNVPVKAVTPGTVGNVAASSITIIQTGIPFVDTVTNALAFTAGVDSETDAALKARFILFINQLAKGTEAAISFAVASLQPGMQINILDNKNLDGSANFGTVSIVVDDGSGAINAALLASCQSAVATVRAAGILTTVYPATRLAANVTMILSYAVGYYPPTVIAQVVAAITTYINTLGIGQPLRYTKLEQLAYDASNGVINVTGVILNGNTVDLIPSSTQTIKPGSLIVS